MHGNHVGPVKPALSERERKRQSALEEKNKTVALVWWYVLSQAMEHGGRPKAVMDGDAEDGPEGGGRPGASVFSLIQEVGVVRMWKVVSLQWTPATALTTALKAFGSRTSETHNCTHEVFAVCSWMCVHRSLKEMQRQQQQQWHEPQLQRQ